MKTGGTNARTGYISLLIENPQLDITYKTDNKMKLFIAEGVFSALLAAIIFFIYRISPMFFLFDMSSRTGVINC
jgi:hypothetical protein